MAGGLMIQIRQLREICEQNEKKKIQTFFTLKLTASRPFVFWSPVEPHKAEINEQKNMERGRMEFSTGQKKKHFSTVCNMCLWRYDIIGDHFLC